MDMQGIVDKCHAHHFHTLVGQLTVVDATESLSVGKQKTPATQRIELLRLRVFLFLITWSQLLTVHLLKFNLCLRKAQVFLSLQMKSL
jgi:hypothetical protein